MDSSLLGKQIYSYSVLDGSTAYVLFCHYSNLGFECNFLLLKKQKKGRNGNFFPLKVEFEGTISIYISDG